MKTVDVLKMSSRMSVAPIVIKALRPFVHPVRVPIPCDCEIA